MVTIKEIIAQQKREMTKQEYKLLIKMCKQPKNHEKRLLNGY